MYIYIHIHVCIYIYIYIHTYIHMYICIGSVSLDYSLDCKKDQSGSFTLSVWIKKFETQWIFDRRIKVPSTWNITKDICICICIYIYIYTYMCIYIYMYVCVYVYICICMCVYIYIYIYTCLHVCIFDVEHHKGLGWLRRGGQHASLLAAQPVRAQLPKPLGPEELIYIYIYIYMCIYVYIYIYTHTHRNFTKVSNPLEQMIAANPDDWHHIALRKNSIKAKQLRHAVVCSRQVKL